MADQVQVKVLLSRDEAERFDDYCLTRGFKKSTLIAKLVRDHLDREEYYPQRALLMARRRQLGGTARDRRSRKRDGKLKRLASGEPARVLDLFTGCGGPLSLGFQVAGCLPVAGVELGRHAAISYVPPLLAQALATTMRAALGQPPRRSRLRQRPDR